MFSQFEYGRLPDELSMKIMSYLSFEDLAAIATVSKPTQAMIHEVVLSKSTSQLIEFLIFHPAIGFAFIDWCYKYNILPQLFMKKPLDDPWKTLLAVLLIEDVRCLLGGNVRHELGIACSDPLISESFKESIKLSIDTMLNAMQQPFFFTGMPKTSHPNIFLNLKHAGFSFLGGDDFNFKHADLSESFFDFSIMKTSDFRYAKLIKSYFREGNVESCDFSCANFKGAVFASAKITACQFINADMFAIKFSHSYLTGNNFNHSKLMNAKFKFANIISCLFTDADLTNVSFSYAKLNDSDFSGAKLEQAIFQAAHIHGIKFIKSQLIDLDFSSCIHEGRYSGLNFKDAHLVRCNFSNQDLCDAIFVGARLSTVNFTEADLYGADFFEATLININFTNCKIAGFEFKNGKFIIKEADFSKIPYQNQKDLNLGAILALQFYLTKLIEGKRTDIHEAIASLKLLIDHIHANLATPLSEIIVEWQRSLLESGVTCEKALSKRHVFYSLSPNSFFEPIALKNEIIELIEQISNASLSRHPTCFL